MENFLPENMEFRGKWRDYQQDFLDEISAYLSDKKLNVVAAPGAGKTTLGVEIIKRLGKPALVLSPSITIKNQWKERIVKNFLPAGAETDWISTDLRNIKTITSTTYQAAHTFLKNPEIKKTFIEELKNHGVKTVVLDESHHLRTEWYKTLDYLCRELVDNDFTVVSLTATPPYDVSESEWANYNSLCGCVDVEISIPELVKNKDLCPHQDILWFSSLSEEEKKFVFDFNKNRKDFFDYINFSSDFSYSVKTSDFVSDYEKNIELIYSDTNFTISLISYLLSIDDMSVEAKVLSEFLCLKTEIIPKFDYKLAQTLFNGILGKFKQHFKNVPLLKSKLKEHNLLNSASSVDFTGETDIKKVYAKSVNKLSSIKEITRLETRILGKNLREVVLLDYIGEKKSLGLNVLSCFRTILDLKAEFKTDSAENSATKLKNEAAPSAAENFAAKSAPIAAENIAAKATKDSNAALKPAILTGSLIVIPKSAKNKLYELAQKHNFKKENILAADFDGTSDFLRIEVYGNTNLTQVVTDLFEIGEINVLIGTQALLGEGWDAPCVNSLIIASTVGSFMLSNQMRGRALRIDRKNPEKTANIWHLASLTQQEGFEQNTDLEIIKKRFETFEGISFVDQKIQNGLARLGYDENHINSIKIPELNAHSVYLCRQRENLAQKWNQIFEDSCYTEKNLRPKVYETLEMPEIKLPKICYNETKNPLLKIIKNFVAKNYIENAQKELVGVVNAILKTLCCLNLIMTDYEKIKVINKINYDNKRLFCDTFLTITGCTNYERNLFIKTVNEFFSAPKNQRYIIKKEIFNKKSSKKQSEKIVYYAVPAIIGTKRKNTDILRKNLEPFLGYMEIVFTRNPEGRKELLRANCTDFDQKIKKAKVWF